MTAVDTAKGQVTLDHGAIAELEWPPMTMAFAAKPALLKDIKTGDKVAFELDWDARRERLRRSTRCRKRPSQGKIAARQG